MVVNDDEGRLAPSGVWATIASKLAPTVDPLKCSPRPQTLGTALAFLGFKYLVKPWNHITSAGLPLIWIDLS